MAGSTIFCSWCGITRPTEPTRISSDPTDPVTRSVYEPFLDTWARRFARLRWLQQGSLHVYLVYILAAVTFTLAWTSLRRLWGAG